MDRWLFSFFIAHASALVWHHLPPLWLVALVAALSLICLRFQRFVVSGVLAGIVWAASVGHWYTSWQLSEAQYSSPVWVEGRVLAATNEPVRSRFTLQVSDLQASPESVIKPSLRLSWRYPPQSVYEGQRLKLWVKLKPAYGSLNLGGFNYPRWLLSKGITATGYVKEHRDNQWLDRSVSWRQQWIQQLKAEPLPASRWLLALSLGDRGAFDDQDWQMLQLLGLTHLVAISGLHLGIVAVFSYGVLAPVFSILARHHQRVNAHSLALLVTGLVALGYAYLAGMQLPVLRAWLMLMGYCVLVLTGRHWSGRRFLLWCLALFVLIFPLSIYSLSFWLSFGAIMIIGLIIWRWPSRVTASRCRDFVVNLVKLQMGLSLLMTPLVAWQFGIVSWVAPLINLLAVPLVTLVIVPCCITLVMCLMVWPDAALIGFTWLGRLLDFFISHLNNIDPSVWLSSRFTEVPGLAWLSVAIGTVVLCLPWVPVRRYWLSMMLLPVLTYLAPGNRPYWQMDLVDVGQGLSVLIQHRDGTLLYDTGPAYPSGYNAIDSHVLPLLYQQGVEHLDYLFLSHSDNDHSGGAAILREKMQVEQVVKPESECHQGWQREWGRLKLTALWPPDPVPESGNDSSCVVRIEGEHHAVLLSADIGRRQERALMNQHPEEALRASVLVAPHHGSNTSSSNAFINAVSASLALFSAGYRNQWHFPRPEVVKRYKDNGVRVMDTITEGQIRLRFYPDGSVTTTTYRRDMAPYWYNQPH